MATFGTFVSGQILTAAELNTAGVYQDYTPTWTQSATITKTVNWARYSQLNKLVTVSIKMTATGAGTANNIIKVGLPVSASANNLLMGQASVLDVSSSPDDWAMRVPVFDSATTVAFYTWSATGIDPSLYWGLTGGGTIAPTIASGDIMYLNLTYEAA